MTVGEILSVLWHRKLIVAVVTLLAIGAAVLALSVVSEEYEATSTVALSPSTFSGTSDLVFFQTIDPLVSVYAAAAETQTTQNLARAKLGGELADIEVRTFDGSPVFKIVARGTDPTLVQRSAQAVTDALVARVKAGQVGVRTIRVGQIDRPVRPNDPVFPNWTLTLAVALLLGLGFGVAVALLRENLSRRVRTRAELAEAAGVPVYAEVPSEKAIARSLSPEALLSRPSLRAITEALRELRTNLAFAEDRARSVVVTSPEGHHGKTTIAIGLAVTTARGGSRTIIVDADLRRGTVAEKLGLDPVPGLYEVLNGTQLSIALRRTSLKNLDVLPSGRLVIESSELLSAHFPQLLEQLEEEYDAVIIDTTPLVPVNDARVVASAAKATILVVSSGKASERSVQEALERLSLLSIRPAAAVLNKSKSRQVRDYYGDFGTTERPDDGAAATQAETARSRSATPG